MYCFRKKSRSVSAYSLLEVLMVLAVFSTVAAGGILTVTNVTRAVENTKLQRDVAVINRAIRIYLVNGGTFLQADLRSPTTVLRKLKTRASKVSAKQLAGVRSSMTDERLNFEMQSSSEAGSDVERARFVPDPANPRFAIEKAGSAGIRRFFIDANLAGQDFGEEERATSMKLAKTEPWVWDYNDTAIGRAAPSTTPATTPGTAVSTPSNSANIPLNAPGFSLASITDKYTNYPKSLTLIPTNPSGTSEILYSVNSGPLTPYSGAINEAANTTITALSISLDPDHYEDSATGNRTYAANAIVPVATLAFAKNTYTYFELGGKVDPATPNPPAPSAVNGTGQLQNLAEIPVSYQNSSTFRYVWTVDGTSPLTSGTAQSQPNFTGGFTGASLPAPVTAFGSATTVSINGAIKSQNAAVVTNSAVVTQTLTAVPLPLRKPLATIDGRDVTLKLDLSGRDMPENARIYYNTDGTDPGINSSGDPVSGTLYTGTPFTLVGVTGTSQAIIARTYPPVNFRQFFTASSFATTNLILPPVTDVYVGGIFVNSGGSVMRNIAKLNNSGSVDSRFDTGSGASSDSLVGVVRQGTGGVMAGGDFISMNGISRAGAVLLTMAGAVDPSFNADLTTD